MWTDQHEQFPETFAWGEVDSVVASAVGERLSEEIRDELRQPADKRINTPGMREALRLLWLSVRERETRRRAAAGVSA